MRCVSFGIESSISLNTLLLRFFKALAASCDTNSKLLFCIGYKVGISFLQTVMLVDHINPYRGAESQSMKIRDQHRNA